MRKTSILVPLFLVFFINSFAQQMPQRGTVGTVYGKVVDSRNRGLDAASVQIIVPKFNAEFARVGDSLITGMLTRSNGDFSFTNIRLQNNYRVVITAIGYKKIEETILISSAEMAQGEKDLGNLRVEQEAAMLQNVTVTATTNATQIGIDRKIFNVERNITSAGGTAVDVMRNIPSLTVDVEGNVQLRNAAPQIFVDGRPTILTLEQIPADNIESVELITNPSAKFDAASTAGIINVVLKKNRTLGLNGIVSAGVGTPGIYTGNLSLNLRQGKVNMFVSGNFNQSGGKARGETFRQNKRNNQVTDYFNQFSNNDRMRRFASVRFGFDYFIDNRNTLTLSQNFVKGRFSNDEEQDQEYLDISRVLVQRGFRQSESNAEFDRSSTQLLFTHKFPEQGKQLSADVNYNFGKHESLSGILNTYSNANGTPAANPNRVRNDGIGENDQVTIQVDYVDPIGENGKFETGARTFINNFTSEFNAFAIQNGGDLKLPLSNKYKYKEVVNAAYFTYSNKVNTFAYQLGLRAEQSDFKGYLLDRGQEFGYRYPNQLKDIWDALFPSIYLTKTVGEKADLQLNYSRRVRRPNFRNLNPFIDISDPVNLQQGNPQLRPEFTNSFEFNYSKGYKGGNFLGVLYWRNTLGDVTQFSDTITAAQYQQLNNAAVDPNAILNTFINANSSNRVGAEFTLQQTIAKNFDITPNLNLQYRNVNADAGNNTNLSNEGFNWESKLIVNYKIQSERAGIFNNLGFQLTGEYESPEIIPQGKRKEQYSVDFALRKELFNRKGSITFNVNDVFNSRRFGTIYDTENFYQDSYRRWNVRTFRLVFSYRFGNPNFSLRRDRNRQQQPETGEDDMGF